VAPKSRMPSNSRKPMVGSASMKVAHIAHTQYKHIQ